MPHAATDTDATPDPGCGVCGGTGVTKAPQAVVRQFLARDPYRAVAHVG